MKTRRNDVRTMIVESSMGTMSISPTLSESNGKEGNTMSLKLRLKVLKNSLRSAAYSFKLGKFQWKCRPESPLIPHKDLNWSNHQMRVSDKPYQNMWKIYHETNLSCQLYHITSQLDFMNSDNSEITAHLRSRSINSNPSMLFTIRYNFFSSSNVDPRHCSPSFDSNHTFSTALLHSTNTNPIQSVSTNTTERRNRPLWPTPRGPATPLAGI
jgi:hypothetical protein